MNNDSGKTQNDVAKDMMGMGKNTTNEVKKGVKKVKKTKKMIQRLKMLGKILKSLAVALKGLVSIIVATWPFWVALLVVIIVFFIGYFMFFELRGAKQDYVMTSLGNDIEYKTSEEGSMYPHSPKAQGKNEAVKNFFKQYADNSYYQISLDNNTTFYEDPTTSGVRDYYNKEPQYLLDYNLLYVLDSHLYKDAFHYPEQFVKPVHYDPSTLKTTLLTDDEGNTTSESIKYQKDENATTKATYKKVENEKEKGKWDYGLASVYKYKKDELIHTAEGKYNYEEYWNPDTLKIEKRKINEPFSFVLDGFPQEIHVMTHAMTMTGSHEFAYKKEKSEISKLSEGTTDNPKELVTKVKYGTVETYKLKKNTVQIPYEEFNRYRDRTKHETMVIDKTYDKVYTKKNKDGEKVKEVVKMAKVTYTTKTNIKQEPVYKYRTGAVYETKPVPDMENDKHEDLKDAYFKQYVQGFEAFIPENVMTTFDFKESDANSYTLGNTTLNLSGVGSAASSQSVVNALQYLPYAEKWGQYYGIDPYVIIGNIAQESGGRLDAGNGAAFGLMQIEHVHYGQSYSVTLPNGQIETGITPYPSSMAGNPDAQVRYGVVEMRKSFQNVYYNFPAAMVGYNLGGGGLKTVVGKYAKEKYGVAFNENATYGKQSKELKNKVNEILQSNDNGWLVYRQWYKDTGHLVYGQGGGNPTDFEKKMSYYVGQSPWVIDDKGNKIVYDVSGSKTSVENGVVAQTGGTVSTSTEKSENQTKQNKALSEARQKPFSLSKEEYDSDGYYSKYEIFLKDKEIAFTMDTLHTFQEKVLLSRADASKVSFYKKEEMGDVANGIPGFIPNGDGFIRPTTGRFSSPFGMRWGRPHNGIDIAAPEGTPVIAAADGVVRSSVFGKPGNYGGYGNVVVITHNINGQPYETLYAHLHTRKVEVGQTVKQGEIIGTVGNTGNSQGNHLHFETHLNKYKNPIDPAKFGIQ